MKKLVSGHQPSYLPWLGYIDKIVQCDGFVLMDNVQFARRDFIHKNIIVGKEGPILLSIPIAKSQEGCNISDVLIAKTSEFMSKNDWQYQHLNSIRHAYRRAPYFEEIFPDIESIYTSYQYDSLIQITDQFLEYLLKCSGIPTSKIVRMSQDLKETNSRKDRLVLDHCLELGASHVLFGSKGKEYVDVEAFSSAGISVLFQDFDHPVYEQVQRQKGGFVEKACFIDALMNLGRDGFARVIQTGA